MTEYKEKALQALNRSDSPGKLRRVVADENRPPIDVNRASPLKQSYDQNQVVKQNGPTVVGSYSVVRDLERIEASSHKPSYPESYPFSRRIDIQSEYIGASSTGSPLRNRR